MYSIFRGVKRLSWLLFRNSFDRTAFRASCSGSVSPKRLLFAGKSGTLSLCSSLQRWAQHYQYMH